MEVFLKILKEIGIAILLGLLVAAVAAIVFIDKIPFSKKIPESINYTNINKNDYDVRGDVEDKENPTETYVSNASQLKQYEFIKYILPGRYRPFGGTKSVTDIPSEYYVDGNTVTIVETPVEENAGEEGGELENGSEGTTEDSKEPADLIEQGLTEQGYGEIDTSRLKGEEN